MNIRSWWAALVPAGTPKPIVDQINVWFSQVVATEETKKFLNGIASDPWIAKPDEGARPISSSRSRTGAKMCGWPRSSRRAEPMTRMSAIAAAIVCVVANQAAAQGNCFEPITRDMLVNPPAGDWLMLNRTYDEQRFSPLDQINRGNVGQLRMAWTRGLAPGTTETTPIVAQGVMYVVSPGAGVLAVNAVNGDLIWEYWRETPKDMADVIGGPMRASNKGVAVPKDLVFYDSPLRLPGGPGCQDRQAPLGDQAPRLQGPDPVHVGADRRRRQGDHRRHLRKAGRAASSRRTMPTTAKELWRFYNTPRAGRAGRRFDWGNAPGRGDGSRAAGGCRAPTIWCGRRSTG